MGMTDGKDKDMVIWLMGETKMSDKGMRKAEQDEHGG